MVTPGQTDPSQNQNFEASATPEALFALGAIIKVQSDEFRFFQDQLREDKIVDKELAIDYQLRLTRSGLQTMEKYGYDPDLLHNALSVFRRSEGTVELVQKQYEVNNYMFSAGLNEVPLNGILRTCVAPGSGIDTDRFQLNPVFSKRIRSGSVIGQYGVVQSWGNLAPEVQEVINGNKESKWCDAPTGLALLRDGIPQVLSGISLNPNGDLVIRQFQGMSFELPGAVTQSQRRQYRHRLGSLDWKKCIVDCVEYIAQQTGIQTIGIQSADNNAWLWRDITQPKEPDEVEREKLEKIYDETAKQLGFRQGEDGDWYKPVS